MELHHMHEFAVLAQIQNYSKAADQLLMSQNLLSKHIKKMEDALGVPLFERSTRKVTLTEYGARLIPYAKEIDRLEQDLLADITALRTRNEASLCFGTCVRSASIILDLISKYMEVLPGVHINMVEKYIEELKCMLLDGNCDLAFVDEISPYKQDGLKRVHITIEPFYAILPRSHPLAKEKIHIDQLKNEIFILSSKRTIAHKATQQLAEAAGFEPNILLCEETMELFHLLNKKNAVAITVGEAIPPVYKDLVAVPIDPPIYAEINCIYNGDRASSGKIQDFLNFLSTLGYAQPGSCE